MDKDPLPFHSTLIFTIFTSLSNLSLGNTRLLWLLTHLLRPWISLFITSEPESLFRECFNLSLCFPYTQTLKSFPSSALPALFFACTTVRASRSELAVPTHSLTLANRPGIPRRSESFNNRLRSASVGARRYSASNAATTALEIRSTQFLAVVFDMPKLSSTPSKAIPYASGRNVSMILSNADIPSCYTGHGSE